MVLWVPREFSLQMCSRTTSVNAINAGCKSSLARSKQFTESEVGTAYLNVLEAVDVEATYPLGNLYNLL